MATSWRWQYAYNLAQMGNNQVGDTYAALIGEALNTRKTTPTNLPTWFVKHEPQLEFNLIDLEPLPGYTSSHLLEIRQHIAGAYLWLLESETGYEVFPLKSIWDFGFAHRAGLRYEIADITGDGIDEIITVHEHQPGGPGMRAGELNVFDLSQVPPRKLTFEPDFPYSSYGNWSIVKENDGQNILHFENQIALNMCYETINSDYRWNGNSLIRIQQQKPDIIEWFASTTEEADLFCFEYAFNDVLYDAKQGDESSFLTIENLILEYPFSSKSIMSGDPLPPDARDEMRFQLGLFRALHGYPEAARQHMKTIITNPIVQDSHWVGPAQQFLTTYNEQANLLDACVASSACYSFLSFDQISELVATQPFENIPILLQYIGMPIHSFGDYDFDSDGVNEYWLLLKSTRGDWFNFFVLTQSKGDLVFHLVDSVSSVGTVKITPIPTNMNALLFNLQIGDEEETEFTFQRDSVTNEPKVRSYYPDGRMHRGTLNMFAENLVNGVIPDQFDTRIPIMQQDILADCDDKIFFTYYCHDLYFSQYLLGLAYELAGDETNAVAAYLKLWRDYPNSPFAIMAQAKLQPSR